MKTTPRTGWKMRGVKNPESIADHSFRASLLGML
ncbi:MAG: HD domain-containing protein, partial [Candidatus Aenigmatarchaeota archaeon]